MDGSPVAGRCIQNIPAEPGSYAIVLQLARSCNLQIGRLGSARLYSGFYIYSGSACGPGGLRARLNRHLKGQGVLRWHIDYLRRIAKLTNVYTLAGDPNFRRSGALLPDRIECLWSQALSRLEGASIPVPGFGSSDCHAGCLAHLVRFTVMPDQLEQNLARVVGLPVRRIQVWTAQGAHKVG